MIIIILKIFFSIFTTKKKIKKTFSIVILRGKGMRFCEQKLKPFRGLSYCFFTTILEKSRDLLQFLSGICMLVRFFLSGAQGHSGGFSCDSRRGVVGCEDCGVDIVVMSINILYNNDPTYYFFFNFFIINISPYDLSIHRI